MEVIIGVYIQSSKQTAFSDRMAFGLWTHAMPSGDSYLYRVTVYPYNTGWSETRYMDCISVGRPTYIDCVVGLA